MPNYLLFQAHTSQQVAECRHFLLKYLSIYNLKPPAGITPVVHTNKPVSFEGFTNFFHHFEIREPDLLRDKNSKTKVLHQFLLQNSGNVLYCNSATYPLQPLEPLFTQIENGNLYLHAPRRHPETELNAALRKATSIADKTKIKTPASSARINIWHAAVVGLNDNHKEKLASILQEEPAANALASDYAYTKQFSEGGKIKSAGKYIFDYSDFKEFSQLLEAFFRKTEEESIPNQIKLLHHIDAAAIRQQRDQYQQQPFFKKWLQRVTGKHWSIKKYESRW